MKPAISHKIFTALLPLLLAHPLIAQISLSYEPRPLGTESSPLILRTYCPDPGLSPSVLSHHHRARTSPKYNVSKGKDTKGSYEMIKGLPAAIAVNHGPALSYVFDTTECRLLYVWQGGFLDMFPYWGDETRGNRRSFDYVPRLVGTLIYQATSPRDENTIAPEFLGYILDEKGVPTFHYKIGEKAFTEEITPSKEALSFTRTIDGKATTIAGKELSKHIGFNRNLEIETASISAGEDVFMAYGCVACHTTDGGNSHGPTLFKLADSDRALADGTSVKADAAYLRESIKAPNAKIAKGFPENHMPPMPLKAIEIESLVLYIQSLTGE